MAAVQLSYLPEKGQRLALEAFRKSEIAINKDIATKIRVASMMEKTIRQAMAGLDRETNPLTGGAGRKAKAHQTVGES